jgi:glutathionyl-hydroquinone reductase
MADFERLNRETWNYNNIGNQHHHSNTGIKHPVDFKAKNEETNRYNIYEKMGCPWLK